MHGRQALYHCAMSSGQISVSVLKECFICLNNSIKDSTTQMCLDLAVLLKGIYWKRIIGKTVRDLSTIIFPITGDSTASVVEGIRWN